MPKARFTKYQIIAVLKWFTEFGQLNNMMTL